MPTDSVLKRLKQTIQTARSLAVPWRIFQVDFADDPVLMKQGTVEDNEAIAGCLIGVHQSLFKERREITAMRAFHLPEHHFWHGMCHFGSRFAAFCQFDDINIGLSGFMRSHRDTRVELTRMTMVVVPEGRPSFCGFSTAATLLSRGGLSN